MRWIVGLSRWMVVSALLVGCSSGAERSFRDTAALAGGDTAAGGGGFDVALQDSRLGPGPACTPPEEHEAGYDGQCKGNEGKLALGVPICGCGCSECCDGVCVAVYCDPLCGDGGAVAMDTSTAVDSQDAPDALQGSDACSADGCDPADGHEATVDAPSADTVQDVHVLDAHTADSTGDGSSADVAADTAVQATDGVAGD